MPVEDGWLVGYNNGEFGATLYWFSKDGKRKQKISDAQVVQFFSTKEGILAIEGLAHLGISEGSIIRIFRDEVWKAETILKLPQAPECGTLFKDGRMLLVLSNSLAIYTSKKELKTLLSDSEWIGLYPNSVVLNEDETKAFIGMRQYVVEYQFASGKLRFLIPSQSFLNKLPAQHEAEIREMYGEKPKQASD